MISDVSNQSQSGILVDRPHGISNPHIRRIQTVPKVKRRKTQGHEGIANEQILKHRNLYTLASNITKYNPKIKRCQSSPPPSYGVSYNPISTVNPLIRSDGLGVRFPNYHSLAGTYDIIFYFAQWGGDYIHHRTTKGSLVLSVSNQESVYCKERRKFILRTIPRGGETLKGVVRMDDAVQQGDRVSMGWYNFSFLQNNLRLRVVIDPDFQIDLTEEQIRKANAEIDIHVRGGFQEISNESSTKIKAGPNQPTQHDGIGLEPSFHRGRIKLVAQRGPLQICKNQAKERKNKNVGTAEFGPGNKQIVSAFEAEKKLREYMDVDNSWLSKYINLPKDVVSVIHQFVCPPPIFFLEEGDLWIEVDWNFCKGDLNSIFVARKRT